MNATVTKVTKDARFFSNQSNARRALKKILAVDTATADSFIFQEALEEGGRYWFSEGAVNKASKPQVEADKNTVVNITPKAVAPADTAPAASKMRSEVRNGVRKPIRGKCADVWAALTEAYDADTDTMPTIADVRALAEKHGWNINNATIEFYGWRKFYA